MAGAASGIKRYSEGGRPGSKPFWEHQSWTCLRENTLNVQAGSTAGVHPCKRDKPACLSPSVCCASRRLLSLSGRGKRSAPSTSSMEAATFPPSSRLLITITFAQPIAPLPCDSGRPVSAWPSRGDCGPFPVLATWKIRLKTSRERAAC